LMPAATARSLSRDRVRTQREGSVRSNNSGAKRMVDMVDVWPHICVTAAKQCHSAGAVDDDAVCYQRKHNLDVAIGDQVFARAVEVVVPAEIPPVVWRNRTTNPRRRPSPHVDS
jgi:hypothetical protein